MNLKRTLHKRVSLHNHRRGPKRLIATGMLSGRGQGQPNGRWPRGHWTLSRLTFSPPGSLWKSRWGHFSNMLSRWGHGEPEMPNRCPQRRSISTLGNDNLLRGGCKFQTFTVWVSNVHISQMCTWFNISSTTSVLKHIRLFGSADSIKCSFIPEALMHLPIVTKPPFT